MQPVLLGENVKGEEKNGNMLKKKKKKTTESSLRENASDDCRPATENRYILMMD